MDRKVRPKCAFFPVMDAEVPEREDDCFDKLSHAYHPISRSPYDLILRENYLISVTIIT